IARLWIGAYCCTDWLLATEREPRSHLEPARAHPGRRAERDRPMASSNSRQQRQRAGLHGELAHERSGKVLPASLRLSVGVGANYRFERNFLATQATLLAGDEKPPQCGGIGPIGAEFDRIDPC